MHITSLLSCYGLRLTPPTSPPTSSTLQHDIGATATGVLTCEGVRVMSASACACRVRASVFTLHLCHMCKVCTLLTRLCFFCFLFPIIPYVALSRHAPGRTVPRLSEQALDNIPYSTVAAANWATFWVPGCDTTWAHLIYSSSSPCMLSVRTEHDMSPVLARKIRTNGVGNRKPCVTFSLG